MEILRFLIYALFLTLPLGTVVRLEIVENAFIYPYDIVVFGIFLSFTGFCILQKKNPLQIPLFKEFMVFVLAALFSLLINSFYLQTSEFLVAFLYLGRFLVFGALLFIWQFLTKTLIVKSLLFFSISGFLTVIAGIIQYFLYPDLRNLSYLGWDVHLYRLFGTFLDPNYTGIFFVLVLLMFIFLLISDRYKRYAVIGGVLSFAGILLTYSRSSYVSLFISVIVFLLLLRKWKFIVLFALVLSIGIMVLPNDLKSEGVKLMRTASVNARLTEYQRGLKVFTDSPLYGTGFNAYRYTQKRYGFTKNTDIQNNAASGIPNSYIFILATTGLLGFAAVAYFWISVISLIKKHWNIHKNLSILLISSLTAIFVHALFENTLFYTPILIWIFSLIGIYTAGVKNK